ncbi:MAG: 4-hydroxybenzoate octaprenyltransferase [Alphaproteobacteria bacterium]|nr:4-hydroxybenzoate octaprenyltransferase [Alphaproteobacteria bacterium]
MTFTDIQHEGWISRLPAAWRPYAVLMRLDRPVGWWLLLLPGWWGIMLSAGGMGGMRLSDGVLMAVFWGGAIIMRGAGCVINDLWDRQIDARVTRTQGRPLASGVVSVRQALIFLLVLLTMGALILLSLPMISIWLGLLSLLLIIVYPLMKRITWWPQAFLGITFNMGVLIGGAAVVGHLTLPLCLLYMGAVFWTLGYDTIYAHQDIEDDAVVGVKSTARLFQGHSRWWVSFFYGLSALLIFSSALLVGAKPLSWACLMLCFLHLFWQVWRWSPAHPGNCLSVFKSNRDYGLLIFLCLCVIGFS